MGNIRVSNQETSDIFTEQWKHNESTFKRLFKGFKKQIEKIHIYIKESTSMKIQFIH